MWFRKKKESILKQIDTILVKQLKWSDGEVKDLWNVLTSLRGPDIRVDTSQVKKHTTAVIRYALPGFQMLASLNGAWVDEGSFCNDCALEAGHHFQGHAWRAAEALGLEVELCPRHTKDEDD